MMRKKVWFLCLMGFLFSFPVFSKQTGNIIALPKSGMQIVPLANMDIPDALKQEVIKRATEQKIMGYFKTESLYADFLLQLPTTAQAEIRQYENSTDPGDSHLKADYHKIRLAFLFRYPSSIRKDDIIGYAPIGGWHDGWTGIKIFFSHEKSVCSFSWFDLADTHGAAQLNQESVTHDVNGKISYIDIEGNNHSGFLYAVTWFDLGAMYKMECANKTYNAVLTKSTILLARKVDSFISLIDN